MKIGIATQFPQLPTTYVPAQTLGLRGQVYSNTLAFKKSVEILNKSVVKTTLNAGHHDTVLELKATDSSVGLGDVVRLFEFGPGVSTQPIYSGLVEETETRYDDAGSKYVLKCSPLVVELGDAPVHQTYLTPTDVAVMVRNAVLATNHLTFTPESIPNTGYLAPYTFTHTTALEVMGVAKKLTSFTYYWFVDEVGCVWFQPVNIAGPAARWTLKEGIDYSSAVTQKSVRNLKNYIVIEGDIPQSPSQLITNVTGPGGPIRITVPGHGFSTGNFVNISGVQGTTEANGPAQQITVVSSSQFDLNQTVFIHTWVAGGSATLRAAPITAVYSNPTSQALYGIRTPTLVLKFTGVDSQAVLNSMVAMIGAMLDRVMTTVTFTVENYPTKFTLGGLGGPTIRYWEPNFNPMPEVSIGSGGYLGPLVVLDVEIDGPQQKVIAGTVPISEHDIRLDFTTQLNGISVGDEVNTPLSANKRLVIA